MRAELQKEIGSQCPFCPDTSVGHFEVHHIDEDPSNHEPPNLLLVCPTCHSKITKGDITRKQVLEAKNKVRHKVGSIEFVSAIIDQENCRWYPEGERIFYKGSVDKSELPIISFTLINHFSRTMVLKTIKLKVKYLPSGLSGIPKASVLKSLVKYRLCIYTNDINIYPLTTPLQIPANTAVKFDTEIYTKMVGDLDVAPGRRLVLYFVFEFSGDVSLEVPPVFLNCKSENELLKIYRVS